MEWNQLLGVLNGVASGGAVGGVEQNRAKLFVIGKGEGYGLGSRNRNGSSSLWSFLHPVILLHSDKPPKAMHGAAVTGQNFGFPGASNSQRTECLGSSL